MYYIDEPVPIDKSFTEKPICAWHIAGRLTIDYINKNTTIELVSWTDKQSFLERGESLVTFLTVNDCPSLFALRALTQVEGSPFYRQQVKCDYDLDHISQVWVNRGQSTTSFDKFE